MSIEKWRSPIFETEMYVQNILLFVSKIGVFGHFHEIASLDFACLAYYVYVPATKKIISV